MVKKKLMTEAMPKPSHQLQYRQWPSWRVTPCKALLCWTESSSGEDFKRIAWRQRSRITNKGSAGVGTEVPVLGMMPVSRTIYPLCHFDDILTITLKAVVTFPHQDAALLPRQLSPVAKLFYLPPIGLRNLLVQKSCLRSWTNSQNFCPTAAGSIDGFSDVPFFCRHPLQFN